MKIFAAFLVSGLQSTIKCREQIESLVCQIDEDDDGCITHDEWVKLVAAMDSDEGDG